MVTFKPKGIYYPSILILKDKMQVKLLKKIVGHVAGEESIKIVDLLYGKKDINEFLIAKKLGLTINQTRNLLYRLSNLGILSSIRKKDKRKGWYIYFWTLDILKSLEILEEKISLEIEQLENKLRNKKTKRFYSCKICGVEVNEETALLTNFICPECGEVYVLTDTTKNVESISKEIDKLKRELTFITREREEEQGKQEKKLSRTIKRIEKKKKDERRARAAKRKKEREKEKRKLEKKNGKNKKKKDKKKPKKKVKKILKKKKIIKKKSSKKKFKKKKK